MRNAAPEGIILDSDNYEDKINHIEISHERTRQPGEALTGGRTGHFPIGIGKSMRIPRISRHGAIYDASAAAHTFAGGIMIDASEEKGAFRKMKKGGLPERGVILSTYRAFRNLYRGNKGFSQSASFKENKNTWPSKTHFTVRNLLF